jgi:AMMECR1 domain-containing protein
MDIRTKLAKNVAEHYIQTHSAPSLTNQVVDELKVQKACYVYLYQKAGQRLRAMHGQPLPRCSTLADEITANTLKAIDDSTVHRADLSSLLYSVAVLEAIARVSNISHLDPSTCGLYIVSDRGKSAVMLPERLGIDTPQEQYATALRESGIQDGHETVSMYKFGVNYYE